MYLSQVFDSMLLPIILVFVMLMSRNRRVLGKLTSGPLLQALGWLVTALISILSVALVISQVVGHV